MVVSIATLVNMRRYIRALVCVCVCVMNNVSSVGQNIKGDVLKILRQCDEQSFLANNCRNS